MKASWYTISGLFALASVPLSAIASPNCPLLGPEFPPPQRLAEHPIWKRALVQLTGVFKFIDDSNRSGAKSFSYSVQVFSTNPGPPILWERHGTAHDLPVNNVGVSKVDGDTVYRLGSVSKVLTVLAFLAEIGDKYWNIPITQVLPELVRYSNRTAGENFDAVRETAWDDVTIASLAAQISGIGRDYGILGEITETKDIPKAWLKGFSPLPDAEVPPCGVWPLCSRQEFFAGLERMFPSFPPWQTATYSNIGYQILAYALESLTKKKFADIIQDRIIGPLGLNRTYYDNAPASVGIIPGSVEDTYWGASLGDGNPSVPSYLDCHATKDR